MFEHQGARGLIRRGQGIQGNQAPFPIQPLQELAGHRDLIGLVLFHDRTAQIGHGPIRQHQKPTVVDHQAEPSPCLGAGPEGFVRPGRAIGYLLMPATGESLKALVPQKVLTD